MMSKDLLLSNQEIENSNFHHSVVFKFLCIDEIWWIIME